MIALGITQIIVLRILPYTFAVCLKVVNNARNGMRVKLRTACISKRNVFCPKLRLPKQETLCSES